MDLYLIRHPRPAADAGRCYGRLDVPLASTQGGDHAAVPGRLPAIQALWSSPLTRCRVLAEAIGARDGITPLVDERLCELHFGEWEGRRWDQIDRDQRERWAADYWNVAPPGGETYRELYERVSAALAEILACHASCIAVVTHAGPIRAALAHCRQLEPHRYPDVALDYGGICLLRASGAEWCLEYLNG
jgi:alpha-ribazole phosphatase